MIKITIKNTVGDVATEKTIELDSTIEFNKDIGQKELKDFIKNIAASLKEEK